MDLKKTNKANLERRQGARFILGLIITLSLVLISFEWTTMTTKLADVSAAIEIYFEPDFSFRLPREETKPPPKPELPPIANVIKMVDGDVPLPEVIWSREVIHGRGYAFPDIPVLPPEVIDATEERFIVEIMPTFNGGSPNVEFYKYIMRNLGYPELAVQNNISGRVIVKFVINSNGNLVNAEVLRSVHPDLDNEALRVINSSPSWEPGIQSGHRVSVTFIFPISFVLH